MIDTLHFEFCVAQIFKNFVVVTMREGITVKPEYILNLEKIAEKYYKDKNFGYITYRANSYAVNPLIYTEASKIPNLVAIAIIAGDGIKESNIKIEKLFFKKPIQSFYDLDQAKDWVLQIIEEEKQ